MLSAWRDAKISGHCVKPVFFFPVLTTKIDRPRHIHIYACCLIHFFNGHLICIELQFFKEKGEKLFCFSFPLYHYLWTQHQCRQSSINCAWNFHGSLIFFFTEKKKRKILSRWSTRKINDQIDHYSSPAERILGIKVTKLAESLRPLLYLNIDWVIFYFLFFFNLKKYFFSSFFRFKIITNYIFVFTPFSFVC